MIMRALLATSFVLAGSSAASAIDANGANGIWARGDGKAHVRIAPCGTSLCATNIWVSDPHGDERVGDKLVMTLSRKTATAWAGQAFDPKRNLTYRIDLTVSKSTLSTRGCIIGGLICRSVAWTRM